MTDDNPQPLDGNDDDACPRCPHPFGPHAFITGIDPINGGVLLCPQCKCALPWNVEGKPLPELPDAKTIARLRAEVFG